ncbi:S41 family peptidase [Candidatus Daviesbacteria bacterium]|nr:S41 family peptidase [Candidatus Daviesbacteria bacterium]
MMKGLFQYFSVKTVLVVLIAFLLGWQMGHQDIELRWSSYKPSVSVSSKEPPQSTNVDFKLFWDTWDLLSRSYIDKKALDPQKMFYGAVSGMVSSLGDPYTVFLPPKQQKVSKEELNGSFDGVGIQLGFNKDKRLVVIAPLTKTPAERAGIKPEDLIVKIDSKDTTNMTLPEAVELIRGPKGTEVVLTILREGMDEPKEYSLIRDTILVKSVEVSFKKTTGGKNVAVIKLSRFGERTEAEWQEGIDQILSKETDGLILDVRNNPGGFLEGAVFIVSEFLSSGEVVLQENNQGVRVPFKVSGKGKLTELPLIVLINKGSASASEIVAGALQDRKRARLVGEKSFGKGTIQEAQDLEGGSGIHITVAKWLTPEGRWVNDTEGLEPDVKIVSPKDKEEEDAIKDLQLEKALELLE